MGDSEYEHKSTSKPCLSPSMMRLHSGSFDESSEDDYWKKPISELKQTDDIVLIHVCDENRQITKDFCCKRNILVEHMKYFESFLAENETGYEDIDISVHCDVEIFEWLMSYIHRPNRPPPLEKALVVSILISSDFLQMDTLVDMCLSQIAQHLGDIIKLPIDLSCISERLLNRLAALTPAKLLAATKDRKDKVLNKLYKRRVELDFSRRSSGPKSSRSIATSLTCCSNCATMYLDVHSASLVCSSAQAAVAFRGKLVRRHVAVPDWSLTSYLKLLHSSGGMSWEQIYWHVWGACVVFRVDEVVFSAAETRRYTLEKDGLAINTRNVVGVSGDGDLNCGARVGGFSLYREDDLDRYYGTSVRMPVVDVLSSSDAACDPAALLAAALHAHTPTYGSGLNPLRRTDLLCRDIFELLTSQMRFIAAEGYIGTIESLCRTTVAGTAVGVPCSPKNMRLELWGAPAEKSLSSSGPVAEEERGRGRSHSPANRRARSQRSKSGTKGGGAMGGGVSDSVSPGRLEGGGTDGAALSDSVDPSGIAVSDRRSRSYSSGPQRGQRGSSAKLLPPKGGSGKSNGTAGTTKIQAPSQPIISQRALFHTLRCFPAEIQSQLGGVKGHINGVWIADHPLSSLPYSYLETAALIDSHSASSLSDQKRSEWEMDLLREYDDKRMDRLEDYLIGCRKNVEQQTRFSTRNNDNKVVKTTEKNRK